MKKTTKFILPLLLVGFLTACNSGVKESIDSSLSSSESSSSTGSSSSSSSSSESTSESSEESSTPSSESSSSSSEDSSSEISSESESSSESSEESSESSSESSSSESSSEVTVSYKLTIGNQTIDLTENPNADRETYSNLVKEYMANSLTLTKDDEISFYKDNEKITSIGAETGSNTVGDTTTGFKIHNDASNASIYLKEWQDGGYSFYVTGYEEDVVVVNYALKVNDTDVTLSVNSDATLVDGELAEYKSESIALKKDDVLTFYADNNPITVTNENGSNAYVTEDGKLKIHNDVTDIIYLKSWSNGTYTLWIGGYEEELPTYAIKLGDAEPIELPVNTAPNNLGEDFVREFYKDEVTLTKDAKVTFLKDGEAITATAQSDANVRESEDGYVIHNDATSGIALKEKKDGSYIFWIGGYEEDNPDVYQVVIGTETIDLTLSTSGVPETAIKQYEANDLTLTEGQIISFLKNNNALTATPDTYELNNVKTTVDNDVTTYTVRQSATDASLYLKELANGFEFYVSGYQLPVAKYYVKLGDADAVEMTLNTEATTPEYMLQNVALTAGETISFLKDTDALAATAREGSNTDENESVYTIHNNVEAGSIYLNPTENGATFYVSDRAEDPDPVVTYTVDITAPGQEVVTKELVKNESATDKVQYMLTNIELKAGTILSFKANEDKLNVTKDTWETNNVDLVENVLTIKSDLTATEGKGIYLTIGETENTLWVDKDPDPVVTYTVDITAPGEETVTKELTKNENATNEYMLTNIELKAGTTLAFKLDDNSVNVTAKDGRNNVSLVEDKLTITRTLTATEGKGIYLALGDTNYLWVDGNTLDYIVPTEEDKVTFYFELGSTELPSYVSPYLSGSMNNWSETTEMKKLEGENVYYVALAVEDGDYIYKISLGYNSSAEGKEAKILWDSSYQSTRSQEGNISVAISGNKCDLGEHSFTAVPNDPNATECATNVTISVKFSAALAEDKAVFIPGTFVSWEYNEGIKLTPNDDRTVWSITFASLELKEYEFKVLVEDATCTKLTWANEVVEGEWNANAKLNITAESSNQIYSYTANYNA